MTQSCSLSKTVSLCFKQSSSTTERFIYPHKIHGHPEASDSTKKPFAVSFSKV